MKTIIALLLGLSLISFAEEDNKNEVFSWDSQEDASDGESTSQSYNGLVIQVYQPDDDALVITLSSSDDSDNVYCLNFAKTYEAIFSDPECRSDCTFEIISGTEVDLSDANCTVSEVSSTQFTAICYDVNDATLTLDFTFKQDDDGEYGLEYTIDLEGYTMSDEEGAKFVMEQSVKDCSTEYPDSGDSGEDSEGEIETENDENDETEAPENDEDTTEAPDRRRMEEDDETETTGAATDDTDSDSLEEEAGVSSDDSREYDVGFAQFIISGAANDVCDEENVSEVEYYMVERDDAIQLVFERFECDLKVDPWFKMDQEKLDQNNKNLNEDGVNGIGFMSGVMVMGFVSLFLF